MRLTKKYQDKKHFNLRIAFNTFIANIKAGYNLELNKTTIDLIKLILLPLLALFFPYLLVILFHDFNNLALTLSILSIYLIPIIWFVMLIQFYRKNPFSKYFWLIFFIPVCFFSFVFTTMMLFYSAP